ncbi:chromosome partitioning protein ParA, partial [Mycobacterium tuberculosis]
TDRNARAEVYVGPAALRLDGETHVEFSGIDEDTVRINASRGNLQLSVRDMSSGQRIRIDTSNLSAEIEAPGEYRITADAATATTWAAVASGRLTLYGDRGISQLLTDRQQTTVSGRNLATVRTTPSPNSSFDTWVAERNRFEGQPGSTRYVQPAVVVPPAAL